MAIENRWRLAQIMLQIALVCREQALLAAQRTPPSLSSHFLSGVCRSRRATYRSPGRRQSSIPHPPRFSATARKSTALPLSAAVSCICTPFVCLSPSVSALALRPRRAVLRSPKSLCVSRIRHPSSNAPLHRLRTARKRTVHDPLPQPPTTGNLTCIHLLLLQTP